jgi:hypothetical protein
VEEDIRTAEQALRDFEDQTGESMARKAERTELLAVQAQLKNYSLY